MPSRAEGAFHSEMLAGPDRLKKEIGYNPTRFNQMVVEHGGPEAVRLLLSGLSPSPSSAPPRSVRSTVTVWRISENQSVKSAESSAQCWVLHDTVASEIRSEEQRNSTL